MLKIGVTVRILYEGKTEKQFVNSPYIEALLNYNMLPIILPVNEKSQNELFALCDGFLIAGGADIDPKYYGETNEENLSTGIVEQMDLLDQSVYEYAKKNKKPVLGICRGIQVMNVFEGGNLFQDLNDLNPLHRNNPEGHLIKLERVSAFKDFPSDETIVNSYHHQAIKTLAEDFISLAKTDSIIEAIIHKSLPIFAVQWHPERDNKLINDYVFRYFISLFS